jgi:hypothetical protein
MNDLCAKSHSGSYIMETMLVSYHVKLSIILKI